MIRIMLLATDPANYVIIETKISRKKELNRFGQLQSFI